MLPLSPQEATKLLLKGLASRRMRDIIEKRYGLKSGRKITLEAIGAEYRITRERVRQIEADALKNLKKDEVVGPIKPLLEVMESHLRNNGGVMAEHAFFSELAEARYHPHLALLMEIGSAFGYAAEDDKFYARWFLSRETVETSEKILAGVIAALEAKNHPVTREELSLIFASQARDLLLEPHSEKVMSAVIGTSKLISQNSYGEYGLSHWPMINPRGVRDKAYAALVKIGKPLHFRQIAAEIDKAGWPSRRNLATSMKFRRNHSGGELKRKAHPQTVHNELIKDPRFVLVGRGLYALSEWGYEPGAVRDIIASVLKSQGTPLPKEEIVRLVLEKRFVKPQTVLLNLQNKALFKKTEDGKYTLV